MSEILFVTKPIGPPWTDGTKTLVRDLARGLRRHDPVVLATRASGFELPRGRVEPLFAPATASIGVHGTSAMRLVARLASGARGDLWHFVFAPTSYSSRMSRALARLRRVRSVQTIPSLPASANLASLAFADRVVLLSRRTERAFIESGVAPSRLRRIPPCVAPLEWSAALHERGRRIAGLPANAPVIVFPGDLEPGRGALEIIDAVASMPRTLGVVLVMAARRKSQRSADAERALRSHAADLGIGSSIRWVGETPHMHALLAAADVVALPAPDLVAKVDLPIVLLEAMSLGRAVVVAADTSAAELADGGGALAVETDRVSLARCLADITSDTMRRKSLSHDARRSADRFGIEPMVLAYEALYDEVLA